MLLDRQTEEIQHLHIRDLPAILGPGDRLVLNNTKVIPASLQGLRDDTGGAWQGLFLESLSGDCWKIVCKTRGRLRTGEIVTLLDREMRPAAKLCMLQQIPDGTWVVRPEGEATFDDLLQQVGRVPLPPYIRGGRMVDADVADYQTVFAKRPGAVAAPTAGLHFTDKLLRGLAGQGVEFTSVTLHVGLGTFRPIQSDSLDEHEMHEEWGELSDVAAREVNSSRNSGGRVVAVGTTVVRLLETAAQASGESTVAEADQGGALSAWTGQTDLFIRPPYTFKAVDALLTNFHFPRTTLLVLVQTFAGRDLVRRVYTEAIREEYRFYSYGDAMLIV
jgi:S-adenosylmethionine:tRNA ribosyltransferase-isomerase